MVSKNVVNIGSGNGLLPQGTRPLPEPMLTYHQWDPVSFTWVQFHRKCSRNVSLIWVWKWLNTTASVKGQWVNDHHILKWKDYHWLLDHHWTHWRLLMTAFQVLSDEVWALKQQDCHIDCSGWQSFYFSVCNSTAGTAQHGIITESELSLFFIKLLSLVANKVVILTTSAAANDKNFVIMRTFAFKITSTSPRNNDLSK